MNCTPGCVGSQSPPGSVALGWRGNVGWSWVVSRKRAPSSLAVGYGEPWFHGRLTLYWMTAVLILSPVSRQAARLAASVLESVATPMLPSAGGLSSVYGPQLPPLKSEPQLTLTVGAFIRSTFTPDC